MIMKQLKATLVFICLAHMAFAQNYGGVKKGSAIGFSANLTDFTASLWKSGPLQPGFSIMYWHGIGAKTDYSIRYNGVFTNYSKNLTSNSSYANELEASLHLRMFNNDHLLNPFLSAGLGGGVYGGNFAGYAPLGGGLQMNLFNDGYITLQMNYRVSFSTVNLDNNLFYSLGFSQSIHSTQAYVAPPPPPIPVVVDTDKDGIPDNVDKCPTVPGIAKYNGCPIPDTDGDGINDEQDKCPTVAGLAKYQGCPIPDTDGDGINDEEDKCPTVAGVAKYQGCPIPDTDGDGVNDEEDKCPSEAGPATNFGCPIIKPEIIQKINKSAKNIFFVTGSAKLLAKSNASLNNVVKILAENPSYKVDISGHTDNTGKAEKNQTLSEARSNAVKTYFVKKGVDETRLNATGYGQDKPIASNKTAKGRTQNRRVEMTVRNY